MWDFPFWLAINDGFGKIGHRYYVERLLAARILRCRRRHWGFLRQPRRGGIYQEFYEQLVSQHGLNKRARSPGARQRWTSSRTAGPFAIRNVLGPHRGDVPGDRLLHLSDPAQRRRRFPKGLDYGLSTSRNSVDAKKSSNPIDNLAPPCKEPASKSYISTVTTTCSCRTNANSIELARRYRELGGEAEIVLLKDLFDARTNSRGHDGQELYESPRC